MKVYAISDLHLSNNCSKPMNIFGEVWEGYLESIEQSLSGAEADDLVLVAGDISWAMQLNEARADLDYLGGWPGKKVIIRGNHDYWWKSIGGVRAALKEGTYALQNDCLRFGEVLVCGCRGWATPEPGITPAPEDEKLLAREHLRMEMALAAMRGMRKEGDKVVVMMHYPPYNSTLAPSGFTEMFTKEQVDAVVFGHLHGKNSRALRKAEIGGVRYYLTSCDLVSNRAVVIDL